MRTFELFFTFLRVPLDYVTLIVAALAAYAIRLSPWFTSLRKVNIGLDFELYFSASLQIATVWIGIFALVGLYATDPHRKFSDELKRIILGCATGLSAIAIIIFLTGELFNSRFIVLAACGLSLLLITIERLLLRLIKYWLYIAGFGRQSIAIIGNDDSAAQLIAEYNVHPRYGVYVTLHMPDWNEHAKEQIIHYMKKNPLHTLLVTTLSDKESYIDALAFATTHHLAFIYTADLFSTYAPRREMSVVGSIPLIEYKRTRLDGWWRISKRVFDIFFAFTIIILASPLMLLIALAIFIETGRPIFFRNTRVGENGKEFTVIKFRTMHQKYSIGEQFKNEKKALHYEQKLIASQSIKSGPVYKIKNDPRVTDFGRVLRMWSLDEMPNFFNVCMGNMSVIGPRPHQPREVAHYKAHHKKTLGIKPGITGLSQISGRSELPFEKEMQLDTYYIEQWSFTMDLFILLKTPLIILSRRGATT